LIGNTSVGTDYQVKFKVHAGNGSSSGNNVYLNSHGESDFSDVRFTNDDGTEILDYWCEYQNVTSAEFWVEVSDDLSNNQTIYVYYGFDGSVSSSDGYATFDWFEDFEDEALDTDPDSTHWDDPVDDDGGGTYVDVVSDPGTNETDQALKIYNDGDETTTYIKSKSMNLNQRGYALGWKWYRVDDEYSYFIVYGTSGYLVYSYSGTSNEYFKFQDGDAVWQNPSPTWHENQWNSWRRLELRVPGVHPGLGNWSDLSDNTNHTIHLRKAYPTDSGYLDKIKPIFSNRYRTQTLYTDDIYVRKYVDSEPGHGEWGAEEALT
ncbi:MAG: DUF2341 domain-containing protein, partial [Candidatus Thorarchaeota archaeon]